MAIYCNLVFRRGYLITDSELQAGACDSIDFIARAWERDRAGGLFIYRDPELPLNRCDSGGLSVICMGTLLDPFNMLSDEREIVRRMHVAHSVSSERFFDYLDTLSGRFVVLVQSPDRSFVLQDATGTKTLFYDTAADGLMISSHASLIAELEGLDIASSAREFIASKDYGSRVSHFPGVLTPYMNVFMLTPNTLLELEGRTVERFFPREPLEQAVIDESLLKELGGLLQVQASLLGGRYDLALSLTGGVDSRLTLSAMRDIKDDVLSFTFLQSPAHEADAMLARKVCDAAGLEHEVYCVNEETVGGNLQEFMRVWRNTTSYMRSDAQGQLAKALFEMYPRKRMHLKSAASALAKPFYRSGMKFFLPERISPDVLARCYRINAESGFVRNAFSQYIETVDFSRDRIYNYDLYDLFYWEHRSGTWQSLQIMDFDSAHDTFIIHNNRHILKKYISLPLKDRMSAILHLELIRFLWPELLEVPFEKDLKPWLKRGPKRAVKRVKCSLDRAVNRCIGLGS